MNKHLHRLLVILIFISVSASAYLLSTPPDNKNYSPPTTNTTSSTPKINIAENLTPAVLENNKNSNKIIEEKPEEKTIEINKVPTPPSSTTPNSTPLEPQKEETIPITFIIEGTQYSIDVKPNSTAYEAMTVLQSENKISFSTKNFSGLGYFVEEINGIKNSPRTGFYWTYYINNQEAPVGISTYIIKPNDVLTWKFENK